MWWWILECLASEKFVLASESNLSLATGLASWKVSLEPWHVWMARSWQLAKYLLTDLWIENMLKIPVTEFMLLCLFQLFITIMDKLRLQIRAMDEVTNNIIILLQMKFISSFNMTKGGGGGGWRCWNSKLEILAAHLASQGCAVDNSREPGKIPGCELNCPSWETFYSRKNL